MKQIAIASRNISGKTGASTIILKHAGWLAGHGWDVTLLGSKIKKDISDNPHIRIKNFPDIKFGSYIKRRIFSWMVQKYVDNHDFLIVHGHGDCLHQDILSLHNCVHKTHEVIFHKKLPLRSGVGRMHKQQLSKRSFKHLIANSQLMKEELVHRFAIPDQSISVFYPGHDPEIFNPHNKKECRASINKIWNIPGHAFLLGFMSSGDFKKRNLDTLFKALSLIPVKERNSIRCLVVGHDKNIPLYRKKAKDSDIAGQVIFTGFMKDPEQYLKAFDVYLHPAFFEEFGQTVHEAVACATPTITTKTTGASELITGDARSLILEDPGNAQKIASLICFLKRNPIKRTQISNASPHMVRDTTWHNYFSQIDSVYGKILLKKENTEYSIIN